VGLDNFQLGGSDEERANDFQEMLDNPEIKAIWCARGGYGTVRIIDKIDFSKFQNNPKWIMGFSDVMVLHSHIHKLGVATLHSIMLFIVPKADEKAKESLKKNLKKEAISYEVQNSIYNNKFSAKLVIV